MSHTDLRDFSPEYTTHRNGLKIEVEKLGGGTLGRDYAGTWRYVVTDGRGTELARAQDFEAGTPLSHHVVTMRVAEYFECPETHTTATNWHVVYYPPVMIGTVAHKSGPRETYRFTVDAKLVLFNANDEVPHHVIHDVSQWIRDGRS